MRLDYALRTEDPVELFAGLAKAFEGCRLQAYHDVVGFPTQGWGHLLGRDRWGDLRKYPEWTQEYADQVLDLDLRKTLGAVRRLLVVPVSARQLAALGDFAFNLGAGNLQASTLLRMCNRGDFVGAADQFLRWNRAGGVVMRGLTRRRQAERSMFLAGIHVQSS